MNKLALYFRLIRADKMNALDPAMFDALIEAGETLRGDTAVRAVVISGRGKAFCAGLDMASFERMQQGAGEGVLGEGAARADLVKRTHGMRVITPTWREERARRRALAPIPQKTNGHARTGIDGRPRKNRHDR